MIAQRSTEVYIILCKFFSFSVSCSLTFILQHLSQCICHCFSLHSRMKLDFLLSSCYTKGTCNQSKKEVLLCYREKLLY